MHYSTSQRPRESTYGAVLRYPWCPCVLRVCGRAISESIGSLCYGVGKVAASRLLSRLHNNLTLSLEASRDGLHSGYPSHTINRRTTVGVLRLAPFSGQADGFVGYSVTHLGADGRDGARRTEQCARLVEVAL